MAETPTSYQLYSQDQRMPLIAYYRELAVNPVDADVVFISKEKEEIKAHRLVLSLSSEFFKTIIFSDVVLDNYHPIHIIMDSYSSSSISAFVQFFYTGEIIIEECHINEFISLSREFNCDRIPIISELKKKMSEAKTEMEYETTHDEYFETNENVETIFFNEIEDREDKNSSSNEENIDGKDIKEEYFNDAQYLEDGSFGNLETEKEKQMMATGHQTQDMSMEDEKAPGFGNSSKKYVSSSPAVGKANVLHKIKKDPASIVFPALSMNINQLREEQERFKKRLQEAINSVRDLGNPVKKASKQYGVPVESIERNLRGFKNFN